AEIRAVAVISIHPLFMCALLGTCTGWAAYAPHGRHRIARTLMLIAVGTALIWFVIAVLDPQPERSRSLHFVIIFFTVPPIVVASILAFLRVRRPIPESESSLEFRL